MIREITLVAMLSAAPLVAINTRSAVSVRGVDTNPCTTTEPCRTFSAAVAQTVDSGEIVALDSAGYGPFTIDRSLTAGGAPGVHASITANFRAITVAGGSDVTIHDLVLDAAPPRSGEGIHVTASGRVRVVHCTFRSFGTAVNSMANLSVEDSTILDCIDGVAVTKSSPAAAALSATVSGSLFEGCRIGVLVTSDTTLVVVGTTITTTDFGVVMNPADASSTARATIDRCVITYAASEGVSLSALAGTTAEVWLSNTLFAHNHIAAAFDLQGTDVIHTFGNNEMFDNTIAAFQLTAATSH